jgi:hypothetical protein
MTPPRDPDENGDDEDEEEGDEDEGADEPPVVREPDEGWSTRRHRRTHAA